MILVEIVKMKKLLKKGKIKTIEKFTIIIIIWIPVEQLKYKERRKQRLLFLTFLKHNIENQVNENEKRNFKKDKR